MGRRPSATVAFVLLALALACQKPTPPPPPAPTIQKVKIVSSLPRIGKGKAQTDSIVNGIRLALQESAGKLPGFAIEYEDWDDASATTGIWDKDIEADNARRAIADPAVLFYVGTLDSGAIKFSLPILNRAGLVTISPGNTYPGLTKPASIEGDEPAIYRPSHKINYYRVIATDDVQGKVAARFAHRLGAKTVYVLHDGSLYGLGTADVFLATATDLGMQVLSSGPVEIEASARNPNLIREIQRLRPDIVYYGGTTQNNAGLVARDLLQALPAPTTLVLPSGCHQRAFITTAGAQVLEGRVFVTLGGLPPTHLQGQGAAFMQRYRQVYGRDPESYGVNGYVAAQVALDALARAETKDREGVRRAMATLGVRHDALGTWQFTEDGDTTLTTMTISTVRGGRFSPVMVSGDSGALMPAADLSDAAPHFNVNRTAAAPGTALRRAERGALAASPANRRVLPRRKGCPRKGRACRDPRAGCTDRCTR
jgi:branched-chain amino acid transport system substrate-binding protein